jgi:hypothetical protein
MSASPGTSLAVLSAYPAVDAAPENSDMGTFLKQYTARRLGPYERVTDHHVTLYVT